MGEIRKGFGFGESHDCFRAICLAIFRGLRVKFQFVFVFGFVDRRDFFFVGGLQSKCLLKFGREEIRRKEGGGSLEVRKKKKKK